MEISWLAARAEGSERKLAEDPKELAAALAEFQSSAEFR